MRLTLRKVVAITVVVWVALATIMAVVRIVSVLGGPREGEPYAYTVSYQLLAFCYLYLVPLSTLLIVVIIAECAIARLFNRRRAA